MHEYTPAKIWYSTESRARSSLKLLVYDDKGCISIEDGLLSFQGARTIFRVTNIQDVQLVRQASNWPWFVIGAIALYFQMSSRGYPPAVVVPSIIFAAMLGICVGFSTKWVRIEYQVDQDETLAVWFADGGKFGWAGILGGTQKLYDVVRAAVLTKDIAEEKSLLLGTPPVYVRVPVEQECPWCEETVIPVDGNRCPACDRPM